MRDCVVTLLVAATLTAACARDPYEVAWARDVAEADRRARRGDRAEGVEDLEALAERAPTALDRARAQLRRARALADMGRQAEALRLYERLGQEAVRREDRARARHEQAGLLEDLGREDAAVAVSRRIARTYPDLMPGLRALHRLERLARARGRDGVESHLAWSHAVYDDLRHTALGDNLLYFAARVAHERWKETGDEDMAALAEHLYLRLHEAHYRDASWEQAVWDLSWLYEQQRRWDDMFGAIGRLVATREPSWFMGSYASEFFWRGRLRKARALLVDLGRPLEAAEAYAEFVDAYDTNRHRDDALFWRGCALLRAGREEAAERAFARIPEVWEDSRYLRRLDEARRGPGGPVCDPPAMEQEAW
ncbi:MAG: hypothetical protein ACQEXJ_02310 [Myxococcota bacterium]